MNIWLMNEYYYPSVGGIETSLYCLSREFVKMGHFVSIIYKDNGKAGRKREYAKLYKYPNRFRIINKFIRPIMPLFTYLNVKRYLKTVSAANKPDLIIGRDAIMTVAGIDITDATSVYIPPTVLKYNTGSISDNRGVKNFIFYFRERLFTWMTWNFQKTALKTANHLIVFSNNMKNQVIETKAKYNGEINVLYPGLGERFEQENDDYYYDETKTRFLFVGRIVDDKNLFMLLDALVLLKRKSIPFEMTIVGDGNIKDQLITYTEKKGLSNLVNFLPQTTSAEKYMRSHDFFVLPSKYEALGQVVLESQSCGTPVIGFRKIAGKTKTAMEELVKEGSTGFLVQDFAAEKLADTMARAVQVYKQKDRYLEMRKTTRNDAINNYSWGKFAKALIDLSMNQSDLEQK